MVLARRKFILLLSATFIALLLTYMPFFLHLDGLTLRIWDEARMASNTLHMYLTGEWIVPHFEGKPDMWCTKPPLLLWLQLGFMKMLGIGELALRLPSALSGLCICILLIYLSRNELHTYYPGILATLILATSTGFVGWHGVRTGDYDILLTFSTLFYLYQFYLYLSEYDPRKYKKYFYLFLGGVVFAFWVKGIAAVIFLPALIPFVISRKTAELRSMRFWVSCVLAAIVAVSYYFVRESLDPGYLKAVYNNEIGGRLMDAVEGHRHPFGYYITDLPNRLGWWVWLFLPAAGYLIFFGTGKEPLISALFSTTAIWYLLVISTAQTKLPWYDIPTFPLIAFVTALGIFRILSDFLVKLHFKKYLIPTMAIFIIAANVVPYVQMYDTVFKPKEYSWDENYYRLTYYFRDKIRQGDDLQDHILVDTVYCAHNKFYMNWMNHEGSTIDFAHRMKYIAPGKKVIVHQSNVNEYVRTRFEYRLLEEYHNVKRYEILRRKDP